MMGVSGRTTEFLSKSNFSAIWGAGVEYRPALPQALEETVEYWSILTGLGRGNQEEHDEHFSFLAITNSGIQSKISIMRTKIAASRITTIDQKGPTRNKQVWMMS
jgi:hypothetical protein